MNPSRSGFSGNKMSTRALVTAGLICIYLFLVCFGNLFRLGSAESAQGVSTYIALLIIVLNIDTAFKVAITNTFFRFLMVLVFGSVLGAFFYPLGVLGPLMSSGILFAYVLLAAALAGTRFSESALLTFVFVMAAGLLIASTATLIDYLKIVDLPYVNETYIVSRHGKFEAEQAGGFFARRSAMAAFYSLYIPIVIIAGLRVKGNMLKVFLMASGSVAFIALVLTHNRSGILAIVFSLMMYLLFWQPEGIGSKARTFVLAIVAFVVVSTVLVVYFPEHVGVYIDKLSGYGGGSKLDAEVASSDYSRIYFFVSALKSMLTSPVGHGLGLMYTEKYGYFDPHNIISHIVWATGMLGVIWIIAAVPVFRKHLFFKQAYSEEIAIYSTAIKVGILSWILNNMTHNSLNMGAFWTILGLQIFLKGESIYMYRLKILQKLKSQPAK